ncbi:hypothetical protein M405DRAFT_882720 [Rhizopogon salebrosus TDB-379]|nr:hypothetical protein M405DRAFT_882720 [Rhizopogon salebrosus TDB-379]
MHSQTGYIMSPFPVAWGAWVKRYREAIRTLWCCVGLLKSDLSWVFAGGTVGIDPENGITIAGRWGSTWSRNLSEYGVWMRYGTHMRAKEGDPVQVIFRAVTQTGPTQTLSIVRSGTCVTRRHPHSRVVMTEFVEGNQIFTNIGNTNATHELGSLYTWVGGTLKHVFETWRQFNNNTSAQALRIVPRNPTVGSGSRVGGLAGTRRTTISGQERQIGGALGRLLEV